MEKQHFTIADPDFLSRLDNKLDTLLEAFQNIKAIPPVHDQHLVTEEFMQRTKISRWKLNILLSQGLLKHKKIGRKIYIEAGEVKRYFNGELQIK